MRKIILVAAILIIVGALAISAMAQLSQGPGTATSPWRQCCGRNPWPSAPGTMGPWMMGPNMSGRGMIGSMPRHRFAMMSGVPAAYNSLSNPLPKTKETVDRGGAVFEKNCVSCHGAAGAGDGPTAKTLYPPPANLVWVAQMPLAQWDPFMYWTIAEGGAQFETAMPVFKDALSKDDIWAVIAYVQARLPQRAPQTP